MKQLLCSVLLFLSAICWAAEPIDINIATPQQLETIKGIGPVIATRIVAYRDQHGKFSKLEELTSIKGISSKWIKTNQQQLSLSD